MRLRLHNHIRTNVVGYVAIFLFAIGGTATALTGSNTVFSDDIVNGEVKSPDLANNQVRSVDVANDNTAFALTGDDIADNAIDSSEIINGAVDSIEVQDGTLGGPDIADGGLSGQDIAGNTLTGDDVSESTLAQVPSALTASLGGTGRSAGGAGCDPESDVFVTCQTVSLNLAAPSRVLIIGRIRAFTESGATIGRGSCRVGTSVTGGVAGSQASLETGENNGDFQESVAVLGVSPMIGPGSVSFGIDCNQNEAVGAITYGSAGVAAVALSAN